MSIAKVVASGVSLLFLIPISVHAQGKADRKPVLAPLVPQIRALVRAAAPGAEFATAKEILVGQYHTDNYTIRLHDAAGRRLPPFRQLGPRPGGFYLLLAVAPVPADTSTHIVPALAARPWTTVTSVYPLADGQKAILMTWEAASGAPPHLADKIGLAVSRYVSQQH